MYRFLLGWPRSTIRRIYGKDTVELLLPCPIDELSARLAVAMDHGMFGAMFGTRPIVGRIRGNHVRARKRIRYRNSFQTSLSAELIPQADGTLVRCSFSMHPLAIAFTIVWFSPLLLVIGFIFVHSLILARSAGLSAALSSMVGVAFPTMLVLFGAALVSSCRWLARDEKRFLLDGIDAAGARPAGLDHAVHAAAPWRAR
ncbi:hypothetical protein ACQR1I_34200 [Bradyrhizobium sp. HKCCYLS2038]|uniref:hypothetical protein n=1 Tax=unclassified Bradyrhizobium TaxID=2631580 RepID=UPI003EBB5D43